MHGRRHEGDTRSRPSHMPTLAIAFPVFDPIAVSIGPLAIRWYALAYIGGIVLGWWYARWIIKTDTLWGGRSPVSLAAMDDFILWVTVGIIVGGRTGYVLFYNPSFFCRQPVGNPERCGRAACRFTAASSAASRRCCCSAGRTTCRCCRWATSPARSGRSACCSGGSRISSTANYGAASPTRACPGL